jgi:subtilisin family serine protease
MPDPKPSEPLQPADLRNQIIVGFDEGLGKHGIENARHEIDKALENLGKYSAKVLRTFVAAGSDEEAFIAVAVIRLGDPKVTFETLQRVLRDDKKLADKDRKFAAIDWVERNAAVTLVDFDDAHFPWQWALKKMGADTPWTRSPPPAPPPLPPATTAKTLVAIVDSGLRLLDGTLHEDLGSVEPLADCQPAGLFTDGVDTDGHGTRLAGTISATYNNVKGIASAIPPDWHISLLPVKFFAGGSSPGVANAAIAIMHAVDKGAKVINASWHVALGEQDRKVLKKAIAYAKNAKRLVVVAAGNDGTDNDVYPVYPANYGSEVLYPGLRTAMLTVAATAQDDFKASFSNYGAVGVDIAAPGTAIQTTGLYLPGHTPDYPDYNGTSAAAAFVSAAAALVFALNPGWTPKEVIEHLKASADALPGLMVVCTGGKRLNLRRAVYGPLIITAPLQGDSLPAGVNTNITWTNEYSNPNFNKVKIEFSMDDGATYPTVVVASTNNDGLFKWKPLAADKTPTGRLRITPLKGNFPVVSARFSVV